MRTGAHGALSCARSNALPHPVERTEWTPPAPGALQSGLHSPLGADDVAHSHPVERTTMRRCTASSAPRTRLTDGDSARYAGREKSPLPTPGIKGTVLGVSVVVAECVKGKRRRSRRNSWVDKGCFPSDGLGGIRRHTRSRGCIERTAPDAPSPSVHTSSGADRSGGHSDARQWNVRCGAPVRWCGAVGVHGIVGRAHRCTRCTAPPRRMPGCSALPHRVERSEWTARSAPPWSPLPSVHGARWSPSRPLSRGGGPARCASGSVGRRGTAVSGSGPGRVAASSVTGTAPCAAGPRQRAAPGARTAPAKGAAGSGQPCGLRA